jgi:hypothetical protein
MSIEYLGKVGSSIVGRIDETSQRRFWVLVGPMQLQQPSVDVGDDRLSLLGDMSGKSNIQMRESILIVSPVPDLGPRYSVEEIREPTEVVFVSYHPVEIDSSIVIGKGWSGHGVSPRGTTGTHT